MPLITRRLEFDAGHRVLNHESKCANLHGHRYVAELSVIAKELDNVGRVIDFSVVKQLVGGWIDEHWDHNIILNQLDPLAKLWTETNQAEIVRPAMFNDKPPYLMPTWAPNPTAENMVKVLAIEAQGMLPMGLCVVQVRLYETPNCWADWHSPRLQDAHDTPDSAPCPYS